MKYTTPKIITIDVKKLFTYFPKKFGNESEPFCLDTTNRQNYKQVIKQTADFDECPMLHQIINSKAFKKLHRDINENDRWLMDILIIMDFGNIFNNKPKNSKSGDEEKDTPQQTKVKDLINDGFQIKFDDQYSVTMYPFDKSGNMSRKSRMTFINSAFYDEINNSLNLGIDFSKIDVVHSKYYAYRGLYLSSSKRVTNPSFVLNEETLVVISDTRKKESGKREVLGPANEKWVKLFTAVEKEKIGRTQEWRYETPEWSKLNDDVKDTAGEKSTGAGKKKENRVYIETPFDGVGFISKDYADYVNHSIGTSGATSFQIRLPFGKGMLHQVDFHGFIEEFDKEGWLEETPYNIKDAFGHYRDLKKAQIIMTESMFKCHEWLIKHCELNKIEDPMKFYCDMLREYEHSLYISGTNLPYGHSAYTHLSYQMINTLALTDDEFNRIISKHNEFVKDPINYIKKWNSDEATAYDETEIRNDKPNWKSAVVTEKRFERDIYIAEQLRNTQKGLITKLAKGKIAVAGQTRYLCRDLLPLLALLLKNDGDAGEFWGRCLFLRFYMPQENGNGVTPMEYKNLKYSGASAFLRSPHLSRYEECLLHAFEYVGEDEVYKEIENLPTEEKYIKYLGMYKKYFGHLTGIVMVPRGSVVPLCLGGADFDGDLVNVIYDEDVVNAVIRGNYSENGWYRKTPVIKIPKTNAAETPIVGKVSYEHIKYTFSNSIGLISNAAISIGQEDYADGKPFNETIENKLTCAKCTILTGLEIDAAKNGIHPNLDALSTISHKADYLKFLDSFKRLSSNSNYDFDKMEFLLKEGDSEDETYYEIQVENCGQKPVFYKNLEDYGTKINKLPFVFMKEYRCYNDMAKIKPKTIRPFKVDVSDIQRRKNMVAHFKSECDASIKLYGYYKNDLLTRLRNEKNRIRTGYEHIEQIIYRIYDERNANEILDTIIPSIVNTLDAVIPCDQNVLKIREKVIEEQWQFQEPAKRGEVLEKIIGNGFKASVLSDEEKNVLFHFNQHGYKLLWYILTGINDLRIPSFKEVEEKVIDKKEKIIKEYFDAFDTKLRDVLQAYYNENLIDIDKTLRNICKEELQKKCADFSELSKQTQLSILYELTDDAIYKKHLFWELFSWDELKKCLEAKEV